MGEQEDPTKLVEITQDVVELAKILSEAASEVPEGSHLQVDPTTFEATRGTRRDY